MKRALIRRTLLILAAMLAFSGRALAWDELDARVAYLLGDDYQLAVPRQIRAEDLPLLLKSLDTTTDHRVRLSIGLVRLGAPAVPALIERLNSPEEEMRWCSASALGWIGPPAKGATAALIKAVSSETDDTLASLASLALFRIYRNDMPGLLTMLEDNRVEYRLAAARALAAFRNEGKPAVPGLVANLKHADRRVRGAAANSLACYQAEAKSAVPALMAAMEAGLLDTHASLALGYIGVDAAPAIPLLVKELASGDDDRARYAAQALQRLGEPAAKALVPVLDEPRTSRGALWVYAKLAAPPAALGTLRKMLDTEHKHAAVEALTAMGQPAADAVPQLLKLLSSRDERLRYLVIVALGEIQSQREDVAAKLLPILTGPKAEESRVAAKALARLGGPGTQILVKMLDDEDPTKVKGALQALFDAHERSVPALPALLRLWEKTSRAEDAEVQQLASTVTSNLEAMGPDALPYLIRGVKSPRLAMRTQCCRVIQRIRWWTGSNTAPRMSRDSFNEYDAIYPERGPTFAHEWPPSRIDRETVYRELIPSLVECLFDDVWYSAPDEAASALAKHAPEGPEALLKEWNAATEPKRRLRAVQGLGRMARGLYGESWGPSVQRALLEALGDEDASVRAQALRDFPDAMAFFPVDLLPVLLPRVEKLLAERKGPEGGGFHATRILEKIPDQATELLPRVLEKGDDVARRSACWAVSQLPKELAPKLLAPVRKALTDHVAKVREAAAAALGSFGANGKPAIPDLIRAIGDSNPDVAAAAVSALGEMKADTPEVRGALAKLKEDERDRVKSAAESALQKLDEKD